MKKVLGLILVAAVFAVAQDGSVTQTKAQEMSAIKAQIQATVNAELDNLPAEVQTKLQLAKNYAVKAQEQIQAMKADGKSTKDIEAAMEKTRTAAMTQLQECIKAMDQAQAQVKAQVQAAKDEVQKCLTVKEAEMKQTQAKDGSGSGTGK